MESNKVFWPWLNCYRRKSLSQPTSEKILGRPATCVDLQPYIVCWVTNWITKNTQLLKENHPGISKKSVPTPHPTISTVMGAHSSVHGDLADTLGDVDMTTIFVSFPKPFLNEMFEFLFAMVPLDKNDPDLNPHTLPCWVYLPTFAT